MATRNTGTEPCQFKRNEGLIADRKINSIYLTLSDALEEVAQVHLNQPTRSAMTLSGSFDRVAAREGGTCTMRLYMLEDVDVYPALDIHQRLVRDDDCAKPRNFTWQRTLVNLEDTVRVRLMSADDPSQQHVRSTRQVRQML